MPQHEQLLTASGIAPPVADARGYRSVTRQRELEALGFTPVQRQVPALVIPIWTVAGEVATYQARPDRPRRVKDKAVKYETPAGARMVLDVPPAARPALADPKVPLFITEGVRKADAAVSRGLCCVALLGVWNWRGTNAQGGTLALPDWDMIALNERPVYIVFDSDVMVKEAVHQALARLKAFLESRRARVALIYLPPAPDGAKVGLDDFLAAGPASGASARGVSDLLALATATLHPRSGEERPALAYQEREDGIYWQKQTRIGTTVTRLTNFTARLRAETIEDDGAETRRLLEIEARCHGRTVRFAVPAGQFSSLNWVLEEIGGTALIFSGQGLRDQTRVAIQLLSGTIPERRVYLHTGWRELAPGEWAYLHAGGTVRDEGRGMRDESPTDAVPSQPSSLVRLPEALQRYRLPEPPAGEARVAAVRASLGLLALGQPAVTVPVVAAIWRAALGETDFSGALVGPSGVFKTELAALAQQHFGAGMDARHLPGAWSSTENALEGLAFVAKDALMVVDDFAPAGGSLDVLRLHRSAERVLRAQGNAASRQRMRADGSHRPAKPPRGLILSTGEDLPHGQSLRSRMFIVEVSPGDIPADRLTRCQKAAAEGQYAAAMAAFLAWIAPQYARLRRALPAQLEALRERLTAGTHEVGGGGHRRTPVITANLALGLRCFLQFATTVGALTPAEAETHWANGWAALLDAAHRQAAHHAVEDPVRRFMTLLSGSLASGQAHLADRAGGPPEQPAACGWRPAEPGDACGRTDWRPQGLRIGWLDGERLYLNSEAVVHCCRRLAGDGGDGLAITPATLHKRLQERGLLAATDPHRSTLTVRRSLEGRRQDVLELHCRALFGEEPGQSGQSGQCDACETPPAGAPLAPPPLWESGPPTGEPPTAAAVESALAALLALPIQDPPSAETEPCLHLTL